MAGRAREPAGGGRAVGSFVCAGREEPRGRRCAHRRRARQWQRTLYRGRVGRHHLAGRGRRARRPGLAAAHLQRRASRSYNVAVGAFAVGIGMAGPTMIAWGTRRAKGPSPAGDAARRRGLVPVVLGARRRLRPRRFAHPSRRVTATSGSSTARRCGRRARSTAIGGCCSRALTPTRPSTRASPRSLLDMQYARHRGTPAAPDHGCVALQRGVPHRRPHTRGPAARSPERRLARREHDAFQRAGAHRRRRPRRVPRHRRARAPGRTY